MRFGFGAIGRPATSELAQLHTAMERAELTYDHIGSTMRVDVAGNPRVRSFSRDLGAAPGTFEGARAAVRSWAALQGIDGRTFPPRAPVTIGATVLVVVPIGPIELVVANRIVTMIDEPDCYGFAYGTLPTHPESGEECFVVERSATGAVRVTVRVQSRGSSLALRLAEPLVRAAQRVVIRRYLDALASAALTTREDDE